MNTYNILIYNLFCVFQQTLNAIDVVRIITGISAITVGECLTGHNKNDVHINLKTNNKQ
jgi:hypothetical protein